MLTPKSQALHVHYTAERHGNHHDGNSSDLGKEYLNQLLCLNKVIEVQVILMLLSGISVVKYSLLAIKKLSLVRIQYTADRHGNSNDASIEYLT